MAQMKFRTLAAGPGGVRQPGSIHEVPEEEARLLEHGGHAHRMTPDGSADHGAETADQEIGVPGETAALDFKGKRSLARGGKRREG